MLLLNQFFHPDLSATAQIATDLAEDLVALGFEVTAVAGQGSYLGGGALPRRDEHRGVRIVRVPATSFGKRTLPRRGADYASFYASAAAALLRLPRHDVVVALTTPPLIAATGLLARAVKGSRLVSWVQDLYPEVAVAMGALSPRSPVTRAMRQASRQVLARSDRVVALGEAMRDRCLEAGARPGRVAVVPNWADGEAIRPVAHEENPLRPELARGAKTVVMYSGNMGRGHDLATLLGAARALRDRGDVAFVFVGDGARRGEVEAAARELPNVRLAPYQPRDRLSQSLSAADVHLIALAPEMEGLIEPSKLYGIMAAGRPVVYVGPARSEVARTIERARCGVVQPNGDAAGVARAVAALADGAAARAEAGRAARDALLAGYTRRLATERFAGVIAEATA